ncbi:MAG: hypothetical protein AVDCRST_MAG93-603 [uncultured Chloroflexia bacterium]|uniref:Sulfotransferase n=1 Tax=uncultured Chloroflexia bacterium TaxID=1672391 RepID=A0A6J4HH74_9CHLR|nr:MAG: hypothetical protein AVDCRST_MAG93-603 [uncultured Chloroflexia bacterium]
MPPDFIGIGAQKAGTTWLYQNLRTHPQIWIPWKELHYFDRKIKLTSGWYSRLFGEDRREYRWSQRAFHWQGIGLRTLPADLLWLYKYFARLPDDRWYLSLFEPSRGRVTGEITPSYSILDRDMVAHAYELVPEARIIFMMRNPIERAWSQAIMRLTNKGHAVDETAEEQFHRRFGRRASRLRTDYVRTLENWSSSYPKEHIFVGFLEDISLHPDELLRTLYAFLGVDSSFRPRARKEKIHSTPVSKMPASIAVYLARSYVEDLENLSERFGGYASFWLHCARRLIEDPPNEELIAYPFWETSYWEEWAGAFPENDPSNTVTRLGSGPLRSIQIG